ncbi:MAG TPA: hypothetical protein VGV12_03315 [Gemmatimonadales bacterium]|nr:hypothetical protein [Gemmatimonadales bacterium]
MRKCFGLAALVIGWASSAAAQGALTDARRAGMGGLSLGREGGIERYNPAYRAVPARVTQRGQPKLTIPIPLGIIQFLHDHPNLSNDPAFDPKSTGFNPILVVNTILNLPLYLEVKQAPTPTNDVAFTIGETLFVANLGQAAELVPEDQFGISGSSRPLDPGFGFKGFRVGVMGWLHDDVELQLGDTLLGFLRDSQPARTNTRYSALVHGIVEGGFAPTVSYAGKIVGDSSGGLYVGGALHYYLGVGYARTDGDGGFITGNTIFGGANPVTPDGRTLTQYSKPGNTLGHGFGGDMGFAWVSGPIELGVGVNDIGATITWPDTRQDSAFYHDSAYSKPVANHVETTTKLPVSYIANVLYTIGNTTLGADILNTGQGSVVHIGGEQRLGLFAARGGIARDQRKRIEFGWGGGVRLGPVGFDVGFWTHTNSLSNERGITMATSLSIY